MGGPIPATTRRPLPLLKKRKKKKKENRKEGKENPQEREKKIHRRDYDWGAFYI